MLPKRARLGFFLQLGRIFFDSGVAFFNGYLSITKNGLIPEFFTLAQTFQNLAPIFGYLLSRVRNFLRLSCPLVGRIQKTEALSGINFTNLKKI